ncbi:MAG TPA: beta-ketoacyl synthase N-terminal-like domain-containing protein, partial [Nitrospirota bacterium]
MVITGMGMVTPLGNSVESTWKGILSGASGVGPITRFDAAPFPCRIAGEIRGFDPRDYMTAKDAHRTDPFIQYALAAALMAMEDARLSLTLPDRLRTGVLVGSGRGGVTTTEKNMAAFYAK